MLEESGLTLKMEKYKFFSNAIDYLGQLIRTGRLYIAEHSSDAIRSLKDPTTITYLKSSWDCKCFRLFVPNFLLIASTSNSKLQKYQPSNFGPLREKEFSAIK